MENSLWNHLPLLVRANSKDSVEHILQSLWRTRKTGLQSADRILIRDMLQLQNDSDLDPLLVCLRMLIRRCVKEDISKDEIQNLFPDEVLPELKKLLTLLLQKFQREWREDVLKDQEVVIPRLKTMNCDMVDRENEAAAAYPLVVINSKVVTPRLKTMNCDMVNQENEAADSLAVINSKLQNDARPLPGELEVQFEVGKDSVDDMLKSTYCTRDQLSNVLQNDARPIPGELEVQFQLQNDTRPLPGELEVQFQSSFPETGSR